MPPDARRRPLLFLDVDGPLIPFGLPSREYLAYPVAAATRGMANPLVARVNPDHGRHLAALPCELAWATTWMHEANEVIAPQIGLPPLTIVTWPEPSPDDEQGIRIGLHWKTRSLIAWAAGRPFAWVDDEITDIDQEWARAYHPSPALLHRVNPHHGLTQADYVVLGDWLEKAGSPTQP
jgi:hypothetical protein